MKPTTVENEVVILNFGSSQFVSCVDSRNRIKTRAWPSTGTKYPAKYTKKKKIVMDSKNPTYKSFNGKKILENLDKKTVNQVLKDSLYVKTTLKNE